MPSSAFATISEQNKSVKIMNRFIIDKIFNEISGIKMGYHVLKIIKFKRKQKSQCLIVRKMKALAITKVEIILQ